MSFQKFHNHGNTSRSSSQLLARTACPRREVMQTYSVRKGGFMVGPHVQSRVRATKITCGGAQSRPRDPEHFPRAPRTLTAVHCGGRSTRHTAFCSVPISDGRALRADLRRASSACRSPTGEERRCEQHGGAQDKCTHEHSPTFVRSAQRRRLPLRAACSLRRGLCGIGSPLRLALLRAVGHYSVGGPASGDRVLSRYDFLHAGHCSRRAGLSPARPRRVFRTSCLLRFLLSDEGRSRSLRRQILRRWL